MDRSTLLAHKNLWVDEQKPSNRALSRLNADEKSLYDDLLHNRLGRSVRLEQERVGFSWTVPLGHKSHGQPIDF
jgi:hypothetical protein